MFLVIVLSFSCGKDELFLQPMFEHAEADVVESDRAEGERAGNRFGPIGEEIEGSYDAEHKQEWQDVSEQDGSPRQSFAYFHFHFVAYLDGLKQEHIHLFLAALGGHTHRSCLASGASARLGDDDVGRIAIHAHHASCMSYQFLHLHQIACKGTKKKSNTQARTHFIF